MLALYKVAWLCCHIVAQVVETELVVCTECNVGEVCLATFVGIRAVLVNAVNAQAVEHIERAHPLRVALGKVVVHCYHVYAVSCQGVEEHRQGSNKCLSLTGSHFGNFPFVQNDTAEQLYIVVYHIPNGLVTACLPMVVVYGVVAVNLHKVELGSQLAVEVVCCNCDFFVFGKAACAVLYYGKSLGQSLVKCFVEFFEHLFFEFVYL